MTPKACSTRAGTRLLLMLKERSAQLSRAVQPTVVTQRVGGDLTGVRQSQETGPTDLIQSSSQLVHRQAKRCRSSLFGLQPIFPLEDIFLQFRHTRAQILRIFHLGPPQSTFVPGIGVPLFMHKYVNQNLRPKQGFGQTMTLEKVAKLAYRRLIRNAVQIHPRKTAHRFHVIQAVFHRRVTESIPLLHEIDAQHHLGGGSAGALYPCLALLSALYTTLNSDGEMSHHILARRGSSRPGSALCGWSFGCRPTRRSCMETAYSYSGSQWVSLIELDSM